MRQEEDRGEASARREAGHLTPKEAERLLAAINRGEEESWNQFYETFRKIITTFGRHWGLNSPDAEDVAQETMIAIAGGVLMGEHDSSRSTVTTRILSIAQRKTQAKLRRLDLHTRSERESLNWSDEPREIKETNAYLLGLLEQSIQNVKEEVRPCDYAIFVATTLEGQAARVVAEMSGKSIHAVYHARERTAARVRVEFHALRRAEERGGGC